MLHGEARTGTLLRVRSFDQRRSVWYPDTTSGAKGVSMAGKTEKDQRGRGPGRPFDPPPLRWSILKYGFEPRRTCMSRKRHKPEEIVAKLRQVDVLVSQGQSVADAVRSIGVTEVTYYRWRQEFGGLKSDQVKRLKDLETENQRLRRAIADLTLDKLILQEAARGNY